MLFRSILTVRLSRGSRKQRVNAAPSSSQTIFTTTRTGANATSLNTTSCQALPGLSVKPECSAATAAKVFGLPAPTKYPEPKDGARVSLVVSCNGGAVAIFAAQVVAAVIPPIGDVIRTLPLIPVGLAIATVAVVVQLIRAR